MYVQRFMLHPALISIFVQAAACWKLLQFANIFQKRVCVHFWNSFFTATVFLLVILCCWIGMATWTTSAK